MNVIVVTDSKMETLLLTEEFSIIGLEYSVVQTIDEAQKEMKNKRFDFSIFYCTGSSNDACMVMDFVRQHTIESNFSEVYDLFKTQKYN